MHASDVLHATAYLLHGKTAEAFPDEELLVTILAACGHDVGHPGINNNYMMKQSHPLAAKYANKGVLENHHVALALSLVDMPSLDVFSTIPGANAERRKELFDMFRLLVLGTDMSEHAKMVSSLEAVVATGKPLDLTTIEHRVLAIQTLIHTADLSNPAKAWHIHIQWTHAIVAEFFSQGDLERARGLEISPMCDRTVNCGRSSQKYFFQHFCRPLFVQCAKVMPDTEGRCKELIEHLDENLERWTALGF